MCFPEKKISSVRLLHLSSFAMFGLRKTRSNSHPKLLLDVLLLTITLKYKKPFWWLLWFISYWDFYDPFLHANPELPPVRHEKLLVKQ